MAPIIIEKLRFPFFEAIECYLPGFNEANKLPSIVIHTHAKAYEVIYKNEVERDESLKNMDALLTKFSELTKKQGSAKLFDMTRRDT